MVRTHHAHIRVHIMHVTVPLGFYIRPKPHHLDAIVIIVEHCSSEIEVVIVVIKTRGGAANLVIIVVHDGTLPQNYVVIVVIKIRPDTVVIVVIVVHDGARF